MLVEVRTGLYRKVLLLLRGSRSGWSAIARISLATVDWLSCELQKSMQQS